MLSIDDDECLHARTSYRSHSGHILAVLETKFVRTRGVALQITIKRPEDDDRVDGPPSGGAGERTEALVACT